MCGLNVFFRLSEIAQLLMFYLLDGLISYDMRQGDRRGSDMEFFDFTYDGSISDGRLTGGLGQLADYEIGDANFRLDSQNLGRKGYEWVGWRNDSVSLSSSSVIASPPVEIIFRFDQVAVSLLFIHQTQLYCLLFAFFEVGLCHICTATNSVHWYPSYPFFG